ncbi:hypothetical protein CHS0354_021839 [Potamilus streckersoni]|uniref:Uncharacterized protein n=1 Tax=Potamilus streckersoni TaxID=2493646 RepID=A0AAE0RRA5_9BIVA|nr:hypothetical protein CHS0354_021839 [Potamilus streckersoni]
MNLVVSKMSRNVENKSMNRSAYFLQVEIVVVNTFDCFPQALTMHVGFLIGYRNFTDSSSRFSNDQAVASVVSPNASDY